MSKIEQKAKQTRFYVVDHAGKREDRRHANPNRTCKSQDRRNWRDTVCSPRVMTLDRRVRSDDEAETC